MNQKRNGRNLRNVACLIGCLRALRSSFVTSVLAGSVGKGLSIPAFLCFNVGLTRSKPEPSRHIRASPESSTWCVCVFLPAITQVTLNQHRYCTTPGLRRGIEQILRKQDANLEAVWPRRTAGLEVRVCVCVE